jgi:hypothetical protein
MCEEDLLDFKWVYREPFTVLNLNKPLPKTHQYRLYFTDLSINDVEEYSDHVYILKLFVNILAWVRTLKDTNNMLMAEEVVPIRQDCKTLTLVNNVKSILEECGSYDEIERDLEKLAESPRELQGYLQTVCKRVFEAIHLNTQCNVILKQPITITQNTEGEGEQDKEQTMEEQEFNKPVIDKNDHFCDLSITATDDMIIIK